MSQLSHSPLSALQMGVSASTSAQGGNLGSSHASVQAGPPLTNSLGARAKHLRPPSPHCSSRSQLRMRRTAYSHQAPRRRPSEISLRDRPEPSALSRTRAHALVAREIADLAGVEVGEGRACRIGKTHAIGTEARSARDAALTRHAVRSRLLASRGGRRRWHKGIDAVPIGLASPAPASSELEYGAIRATRAQDSAGLEADGLDGSLHEEWVEVALGARLIAAIGIPETFLAEALVPENPRIEIAPRSPRVEGRERLVRAIGVGKALPAVSRATAEVSPGRTHPVHSFAARVRGFIGGAGDVAPIDKLRGAHRPARGASAPAGARAAARARA